MSRKYIVKVNNRAYEVEVEEVGKRPAPPPLPMPTGPKSVSVTVPQVSSAPPGKTQASVQDGRKVVPTPMTGTIIKVMCMVGQEVKEGDVLLKLEAMKMETSLSTPVNGKIVEIKCKEGQTVTAGEPLVVLQ
jgi:biotin carboxyl carrier protein